MSDPCPPARPLGCSEADITIVGSGVAGTVAAVVLARQGVRVTLVDPLETMPPRFRAEKIEPDQAALLRRFELLAGLLPWTAAIRSVDEARAGRLLRSVTLEQYGVFFHDLVNQLRREIPSSVGVYRQKAVETSWDGKHRRVRLDDATEIRARLVVLACGTSRSAQKVFGLARRSVSRAHSLAFGFSLAQLSPKRYHGDALTCFGDRIEDRIDAISLFPIRDQLRANLFTYWPPKAPQVRAFAADPLTALADLMPGLSGLSGALALVGKVQLCPIDLDLAADHRQPGLVVIGDAFQSVCPATGTGLSKVLTDVERLAALLPAWLAGPDLSAERIDSFYRDPVKVACDRTSLEMALRMRRTATDPGLRWQLQRRARSLKKGLQGWGARLLPKADLAARP